MKILVLDVPGLHLGYLGFYGNDWIATPNLDALAARSVVFDRHYAGGPNDLATGRYHFPVLQETDPGTTRVDSWFSEHPHSGVAWHHLKAPSGSTSTIQCFQRAVQQTLAVFENAASAPYTLVWSEFPSLAPPWHFPADMLDGYFEEDGLDGPWLDPGEGMLPEQSADTLECLQNTYAAVVTFVDDQIGGLIEELTERGVLDDLLLCVTSRLGLPLGEHGLVGYARAWQHEELVHLPLLLRLPGEEKAGLRIGALTQPADIVPTLLEHLGAAGQQFQGRSLWPLIREEVAEIRPFACSGFRVGESLEWSLRTPEWALLLPQAIPSGDPPRGPQLFVKPDDRWEVNDVRQHHLDLADELEKTLRDFITTSSP